MTDQTTTLERVARAIEAAAQDPWGAPVANDVWPIAARAAIEVLMEPSEGMLNAWIAEAQRQGFATDEFSEPIYPVPLWQAMLRHILEEGQ